MSLAAEILRIVAEAASREGFRRVAALRLEAGALAGVEPDALRFALDCIVDGTCLAGARVDIDEPPGRGWCTRCACEVLLASRADACPGCGTQGLRPTGGDALRVVEMIVQD